LLLEVVYLGRNTETDTLVLQKAPLEKEDKNQIVIAIEVE